MRALVWSTPFLLAATVSLAGRAKAPPPPPRDNALALDHGGLLVEQPESFDVMSAWHVTDGLDEHSWRSPDGAPQGASFVWELDATWRLDTLAISTKGADEARAPGSSAKTVELFVADVTGPWTSLGQVAIGKRERRELALPAGTKAARVRVVVLENHGHAQTTELSELAVFGKRASAPFSTTLAGAFSTPLGPMRFTQRAERIAGCFDTDGGPPGFVTGTLTGRIARVIWQVIDEDGATERTAVFAISRSGDRFRGVVLHEGSPEAMLTGMRVSSQRGPACTPSPPPPDPGKTVAVQAR